MRNKLDQSHADWQIIVTHFPPETCVHQPKFVEDLKKLGEEFGSPTTSTVQLEILFTFTFTFGNVVHISPGPVFFFFKSLFIHASPRLSTLHRIQNCTTKTARNRNQSCWTRDEALSDKRAGMSSRIVVSRYVNHTFRDTV